jgi:hypothetical protein
MGFRPSAKLPEYFREKGYFSPENYLDGPFQYAFGTSLSWFPWLEQHKREFEQFNNFMTNFRAAKPAWVDLFPAASAIFGEDPAFNGVTNNGVLGVDIGGGYGHDLEVFCNKFPSASGKVVLQDLPSVVQHVPESRRKLMEVTSHDFMHAQPIHGKI